MAEVVGPEARMFIGIVVAATLSIAAVLVGLGRARDAGGEGCGGPVEALRDSLFQVTRIITTAGFATEDFDSWPQFCRILLMLLAFCGPARP